MDDAHAVAGEMRKKLEIVGAGILGDRHYPVRGDGGAKDALETADPVGFRGPFGIDDKPDVIKRVNQAAGGELHRRPEIIGVDDIRMAKGRIQVGLIPKGARSLARQVTRAIARVLSAIRI